MKYTLSSIVLAGLVSLTSSSHASDTVLDKMPRALEMKFALSALPPALRSEATALVLDPAKGYELAQRGTNGVTCIVQRTVWEMNDYRNDIYIPLCYDAVGTSTYLKVITDAAALRAQGVNAQALNDQIQRRWSDKTYQAPTKAGVSYMVAPLQRTIGPPDLKVHTLAMPHLMPYAPGVTNEDIGAKPNLAEPASLHWPFIDKQGNAEQSYLIHMMGAAERAKILRDEQPLIAELCAYRDVLCLPSGEK